MRQACSSILLFLLCCAVLVQAGCSSRHVEELLWPDRHDAYFLLTESWSRSDIIRESLEQETKVVALLKSKQWRTGYVQRYSEVFGLTPAEKDKMLSDQFRAAEEATEFVLAISSTDPDDARLTHRLVQWRVLLSEHRDKTVKPLEIRPLDVHNSQLKAFYPNYSPWQRYYIVRFPKVETDFLTMLFTGPAGQIMLTWETNSAT